MRISVIGPSACGKTSFIAKLKKGYFRIELGIPLDKEFIEIGRPRKEEDTIFYCDTGLCEVWNYRLHNDYILTSDKIIIVYCPPSILKRNMHNKLTLNKLITDKDINRYKINRIAYQKYQDESLIKFHYKKLIEHYLNAYIYRVDYVEHHCIHGIG